MIIEEIDKKEILNILKNDNIIAIPTDTVYGLAIKTDVKENYNKLLEVKNRPKEKLFPIVVSSIEQIEEISYLDSLNRAMIKKFMPGPITIILRKKEEVFPYLDSNTIAIRMAEGFSKDLIEELGIPLWLTSANKSNAKPAINSEEVMKIFNNEIQGIIDGEVNVGIPSTIIEFKDNDFIIHREGPITKERIKKELEGIKKKE